MRIKEETITFTRLENHLKEKVLLNVAIEQRI